MLPLKFQLFSNINHLKYFIITYDDIKKNMQKKLLEAHEATKRAVDEVEAANAWAKAIEVQKDAIEAWRSAVEATNIELVVTTTVEMNKLKTDLSCANKEVR